MSVNLNNIFKYFKIAIKISKKSLHEIPVGCLLLQENGKILLTSHNKMQSKNPLAHAEMNILNAAYKKKIDVSKCLLISTLEPCCMCKHALALSKVKKVLFGAYKKKNTNLYKKQIYIGGFYKKKCSFVIKKFFCKIRK